MKRLLIIGRRWHMNQVVVLSFSLFVLGFLGILYAYSMDADISSLKNELPQATVFYDINERSGK